MKKIVSFILVLTAVLSVSAGDSAKNLQKAREKERKEVLKQMKKENWRVMDSSKSIETAMLEHWLAMEGSGFSEVVGISPKGKNKNQLMTMAMNNAVVVYSQNAEQTVKSVATALFKGDDANVNKELETFFNSFSRALSKEVRGELVKSFIAYRDAGDGNIEVRAYYVIDEEKANRSFIEALEYAGEEDPDAQDISQQLIQSFREE